MKIKQKVSVLLHLILKDTSVPVLSGPLAGWKWLPPSGNHAYWLGKHERDYVNTFAQHIQPGDTVFDIGAQAGYFTLVASRRVGSDGKVVAFEPFPVNVNFIKEHCRINHCKNVTLLEIAVGGSPGKRSFQAANAFMGHLSTEDLSTEDLSTEDLSTENTDQQTPQSSPEEAPLVVKVNTLDALPLEGKATVPSIIKIDTEGMEYWVLQGGKTLIQKHRPILFIATHGEFNQSRTLQLLKDWNYKVIMIGEGSARNADYIAKPSADE